MCTFLQGPPHARSVRILLLATLLVALSTVLNAQEPLKDTVLPRRPAYGVGLDEFWIGGVVATRPPDTSGYAALWDFFRSLNVNIVEMRIGEQDIPLADTLADAADPDQRLIISVYPVMLGGYGREAVLYPFDSAQSYYYRNVFTTLNGGTTNRNVPQQNVKERHYGLLDSTQANQLVASGIAFGYDSTWHTNRYPQSQYDPHVQDCSSFLFPKVDITELKTATHYIVLTGHMFDPVLGGGGNASQTDSVLTVEVWCEVPQGTTYRNASGIKATAASDTSYLYQTFQVLKRSFFPIGSEPFDVYHDTTIAINMRSRSGTNLGGPLHDDNSAHRFDVRIRWTGVEKVALRSVTLRDSVAQLMRGADASALAFRQSVLDRAERMVYGPSPASPPVPRDAVIRFYAGDEGKFLEHGPYHTLDTMLAGAFPFGDSVTRGVRCYRAMSNHFNPVQHTLDDQPEITVEMYEGDLIHRRGTDMMQWYGIADTQLPSLALHNGGRFGIPLMQAIAADVERYNKVFQRLHVGAYIPDSNNVYYRGWASELGYAATSSRRTGKRLITWPGVMAPLNIDPRWNDSGAFTGREITMSHIPEAAEIRAMASLSLCYGARGVHYSWIGSDTGGYAEKARPNPAVDSIRRYRLVIDFGAAGPVTTMRENYRYPMVFASHAKDSSFIQPPQRDEIDSFYTGWGTRLHEMERLGRWLPEVGAAMARLRWRNGYSYHFTEGQAWMPDNVSGSPQSQSRAIPAMEIIGPTTAWAGRTHWRTRSWRSGSSTS